MKDGHDWLDPNGVASAGGTTTADTFLFDDATDPGDISAYAGGNKEDDTRDWDYVNSAGPNPKTDFKHIMAHAEVVGNSAFAYLGAERVVNNGTMVVDFELNKKQFKVFPAGGPPKPDRTAGDLLISLEYSNGGSNPIVTIYAIANVQNFPSGQTVDFVKVSDATTLERRPQRDQLRRPREFGLRLHDPVASTSPRRPSTSRSSASRRAAPASRPATSAAAPAATLAARSSRTRPGRSTST